MKRTEFKKKLPQIQKQKKLYNERYYILSAFVSNANILKHIVFSSIFQLFAI